MNVYVFVYGGLLCRCSILWARCSIAAAWCAVATTGSAVAATWSIVATAGCTRCAVAGTKASLRSSVRHRH